MRKHIVATTVIALLLASSIGHSALSQDVVESQSVYEYVVESASATVEDLSTQIISAAEERGWKLLARNAAGTTAECSYGAEVLSIYKPDYAQELLSINRKTAPFAVVDRINIFEDGNGRHIAIVNPHGVNRTVLMDDVTYTTLSEVHLGELRDIIVSGTGEKASLRPFGQTRKRGHIGKTMGVMAGGNFVDKIQDKAVLKNQSISDVASAVRSGMSDTGSKWGLHLVYELDIPEYDLVIFGSSGEAMEEKSFSIVKAGADKSRKNLACAGLAYAAAYPIEVVVTKTEGSTVSVQFVDAMYRMKMYFEDAGKMAFMKNMRMPGSLADELSDQIESGLTKMHVANPL